MSVLVGVPAAMFSQLAKNTEQHRVKGKPILWVLPLAFVLTGIIAIWLPQILSNGRSAAQTAFWGVSLGLCVALLIAKTATVLLMLRSGAYGGTLTPALAIGALCGLCIGLCAQACAIHVDLLTTTLVGAAAFLTVSMNAPLSAFALIVGFTGQHYTAYLPLSLGIACAMAAGYLLKRT